MSSDVIGVLFLLLGWMLLALAFGGFIGSLFADIPQSTRWIAPIGWSSIGCFVAGVVLVL